LQSNAKILPEGRQAIEKIGQFMRQQVQKPNSIEIFYHLTRK
jgi:hypothetical protein